MRAPYFDFSLVWDAGLKWGPNSSYPITLRSEKESWLDASQTQAAQGRPTGLGAIQQ
jgi:hypothetical protein